MAHEFKGKLAPASRPHNFMTSVSHEFLLKTVFKLRTLMLVGALLQIVVCAALPLRWALVPAGVLLVNSIISTLLQLRLPHNNAFTKHVIPGRTTAQIPSASGSFGARSANEPVVVFNLGIQWNHPLGALGPGLGEIKDQFQDMMKDLEERKEELGLLSMSTWTGNERGSNNTVLFSFYFRDVESIHRFAHEELHRRAWDSYHSSKTTHVGVFHETFVVPAGGYESMYVNCHPVMFGRGVVKCADKAGGEQWVNTLVDADTPALKTQYARMGRDEKGVPKE